MPCNCVDVQSRTEHSSFFLVTDSKPHQSDPGDTLGVGKCRKKGTLRVSSSSELHISLCTVPPSYILSSVLTTLVSCRNISSAHRMQERVGGGTTQLTQQCLPQLDWKEPSQHLAVGLATGHCKLSCQHTGECWHLCKHLKGQLLCETTEFLSKLQQALGSLLDSLMNVEIPAFYRSSLQIPYKSPHYAQSSPICYFLRSTPHWTVCIAKSHRILRHCSCERAVQLKQTASHYSWPYVLELRLSWAGRFMLG